MQRGLYIVLEGGDGTGKNTQLELLRERIVTDFNIHPTLVHEPHYGLIGEYIDKLLAEPVASHNMTSLDSWQQAFLYNAMRRNAADQAIRPQLQSGGVVLASRNYLSTLAYQGYAGGMLPEDIDQLREQCVIACHSILPDLTIILDAPASVNKARQLTMEPDAFERLSEEFHEKVRNAYLREARKHNFPVIEANDSKDVVAENIFRLVGPLLNISNSAPPPTFGISIPSDIMSTNVMDPFTQTNQQAPTSNGRGIFGEGSKSNDRFVPDFDRLTEMVNAMKTIGMRIVLSQGTFDFIHIGHFLYLEKARAMGDVLIVGIDSDEKVRQRKGPDRPIVSQEERVQMLTHVRHVDLVTIKHAITPKWELIKRVRPDVLVATKETYTPEQLQQLKEYCAEVVVLEPQATTSTSAKLRRLNIGLSNKMKEAISKSIEDAFDKLNSEA